METYKYNLKNEKSENKINFIFVLSLIADLIEDEKWEIFDKGVIIPNDSPNEFIKETRLFTAHKGPQKELRLKIEDRTDYILIEADITCFNQTVEMGIRFCDETVEFSVEADKLDFSVVAELLGFTQHFMAELGRE